MEIPTNSTKKVAFTQDSVQKLYHYTDFNAMRGIISKGEIWLWNLRRMNDSQEMQYFITELKLAVKKLLNEKYYVRMDRFFSENLKDFDKLSSFAACFSEYADDASQWTRYAKNGMGVCIAFNKDMLTKLTGLPYMKTDGYGAVMYNLLLTRQKQAIHNAETVLADISHGNPAEEESSTTVHKLVKELNKYL